MAMMALLASASSTGNSLFVNDSHKQSFIWSVHIYIGTYMDWPELVQHSRVLWHRPAGHFRHPLDLITPYILLARIEKRIFLFTFNKAMLLNSLIVWEFCSLGMNTLMDSCHSAAFLFLPRCFHWLPQYFDHLGAVLVELIGKTLRTRADANLAFLITSSTFSQLRWTVTVW